MVCIIIIVRREQQRRYVHGRPSAYKRTGGRKVYDFIGRVGQLSLCSSSMPMPPLILLLLLLSLCVYYYYYYMHTYTMHGQLSIHAELYRGSDCRRMTRYIPVGIGIYRVASGATIQRAGSRL